jgi:hypothetical protein
MVGWVPDHWRHYEEQAGGDDPRLDPGRSRGGIDELELAIDCMDQVFNDRGATLPVNVPNQGAPRAAAGAARARLSGGAGPATVPCRGVSRVARDRRCMLDTRPTLIYLLAVPVRRHVPPGASRAWCRGPCGNRGEFPCSTRPRPVSIEASSLRPW